MRRSKHKSGSQKQAKLQPRPITSIDRGLHDSSDVEPMSIDSAEGSIHTGSAAESPVTAEVEAAKRPRACESCRGLKVRCDFPAGVESCKRCARAKRRCIITLPNPRRPGRAESKVMDLERQVQELTAALAIQRGQFSSSGSTPGDWLGDARSTVFSTSETPSSWMSSFPTLSPQYNAQAGTPQFPFTQGLTDSIPTLAPNIFVDFGGVECADIIDRGLLSRKEAIGFFDHFRDYMLSWFPLLAPEDDIPATLMRRTKPILFLAIIAVASGYTATRKRHILTREALKSIAWHVICQGAKSIELIQAMHVLSIWHVSDDAKDTTASQLAQLASSTAAAMRLDSFDKQEDVHSLSNASGSGSSKVQRRALEIARTWLACYTVNGIISMKQRQQNTMRWSSHLRDCTSRLQADGSMGRQLCQMAEIQRISDRISNLCVDISASAETLDMEQEFLCCIDELVVAREEAKNESDGEFTREPLRHSTRSIVANYAVLLLLNTYEATLYARSAVMRLSRSRRSPSTEQGDRSSPGTSLSLSEAIRQCVSSIHQLLEHFTFLVQHQSAQSFNSMPPYHFNRAINSLITLAGFHHSAQISGSPAAGLFPNPDRDLRVHAHINRLLDSLRVASIEAPGQATQRFHMLLKMVRIWFARSQRAAFSAQSASAKEIYTYARQYVNRLEPQPVDPSPLTPRTGYHKLSLREIHNDFLDVGTGIEESSRQLPPSEPMQFAGMPTSSQHGALRHSATWPVSAPGNMLDSNEEFAPADVNATGAFDFDLDTSTMDLSTALDGYGETFGQP